MDKQTKVVFLVFITAVGATLITSAFSIWAVMNLDNIVKPSNVLETVERVERKVDLLESEFREFLDPIKAEKN